MTVELMQGDNRQSLRRMIDEGRLMDSVVCDPPYGLVSVAKRFGGPNAKAAGFGTDGAFSRQSRGFMGKLWDGTGIERDPEFWRLVWEVMKPGAYIIAFSSSRTYGYMQVAMEAAGFITHPMFGWVFNTGFPKGHDVGRAIDKTLGVDGSLGGPRSAAHAGWIDRGAMRGDEGHVGWQRPWMDDPEAVDRNAREYLPGSEEGERWKGWKTGTQSLKPALEPVYFGQKPFSEKTGALNILRWGVGAVNIDACRVPGAGGGTHCNNRDASGRCMGHANAGRSTSGETFHGPETAVDGRYPANLVHDGSPEVVALFPESGGQQARVGPEHGNKDAVHTYGDYPPRTDCEPRNDSGSAARFFNSFPHEGPALCYPKAGKKDRAGSKHATVKPIALMQHFLRLVTPSGGTILDPFAGSGTTGQAALNEGFNAILMEAEAEYARDIRRRFNMPPTFVDRLLGINDATA